MGVYKDNGKEHGNYYLGLGNSKTLSLYRTLHVCYPRFFVPNTVLSDIFHGSGAQNPSVQTLRAQTKESSLFLGSCELLSANQKD